MFSKSPPSRIEFFAYSTLILGILGDHLSTSIALKGGNAVEANPIALNLMMQGSWVQADIILIIISIAVTFASLRIMRDPIARFALILPFAVGFLRLVVTFWNLSLII